ncbi:MAG: eukaryotic translation initiation factor 3 subunit A [Vezdaea aestivalis]|nr:MAG: eukaryotic translation initiation factor 3 subunit A [Vezdaea aestivalis]
MPPPPHTKPENMLKRAQELMAVDQSLAALTQLHEYINSKKSRNNPILTMEPVVLLFIQLCVDLRKGKQAKDGLYQYKNMAQNTNLGTIELVINKFIQLAEQKVTEARGRADEHESTLDTTPVNNIEDLEATETPESILLSTVSGEQSKDRTDRAIVTPWLKFLWEAYRTVLDILRNNSRLEVMYQSTAFAALQFCEEHVRKTEFRRLSDLLRNHVQNAYKYSTQMHAINLNDPDTLQRHLDTRFRQLDVAVELELWQEAFKSIEDIHTLLSLSKRPAKSTMMINYFEKLTRIFLKSENYLFHAAAWNRYYNLIRSAATTAQAGQAAKRDNPAVTNADMTRAASYVLLSALAIPVISTTRSRGALADVDENRKNKNTRLTNLLGMSQPPTRAWLFEDALKKGLLKRARPDVQQLYNILEVSFHPLLIRKNIAPILTRMGNDTEMERYVQPLQQVIMTRIFQQLSQVYETVDLDFVYKYSQFPEPFQVDTHTIEKFILNGCKKGELAIRINHSTGHLSFNSDAFSSAKALHPSSGTNSVGADKRSVQRLQSTPAEIVSSQLNRIKSALQYGCQHVDSSFNETRLREKTAAAARARSGAQSERENTLARRAVIEKQKEELSEALAKKERLEAEQKRQRQFQRQELENQRLAEEQKERERKRLEAEQEKIRQGEVKKQIDELKTIKGLDLDEKDLADLNTSDIRAIKLSQLEKEKNVLNDKLRITGKRIDHLERAFRREEAKHLPKDYEAQKQGDRKLYDLETEQILKESKAKHTEDLSLKRRLGRLLSVYESFRDDIHERRHEEFAARKKTAEKELDKQMKQRRTQFREQKAREKREREEQIRAEKEEEERLEQEAAEKAARDEERRQRFAEDKAKRDEERKRLDEQAAKQRQREAEAEERRKTKMEPSRMERPSGGRAPERTDSTERRPILNLAGGGRPSWRDKQALKDNASASSAPRSDRSESPAGDSLPRRAGTFIPPALRGRNESPRPDGPEGGRIVPSRLAERKDSADSRSNARDESPLPSSGPSDGKYRPGAFKTLRKT